LGNKITEYALIGGKKRAWNSESSRRPVFLLHSLSRHSQTKAVKKTGEEKRLKDGDGRKEVKANPISLKPGNKATGDRKVVVPSRRDSMVVLYGPKRHVGKEGKLWGATKGVLGKRLNSKACAR